jgi:hypothetical protein
VVTHRVGELRPVVPKGHRFVNNLQIRPLILVLLYPTVDLEVFDLVKLTGEVESWQSQFGQLLLRVDPGTSSYSLFYPNVSIEASFPDIECSVLVTYSYMILKAVDTFIDGSLTRHCVGSQVSCWYIQCSAAVR